MPPIMKMARTNPQTRRIFLARFQVDMPASCLLAAMILVMREGPVSLGDAEDGRVYTLILRLLQPARFAALPAPGLVVRRDEHDPWFDVAIRQTSLTSILCSAAMASTCERIMSSFSNIFRFSSCRAAVSAPISFILSILSGRAREPSHVPGWRVVA